jgi:hypothetical protein
VTILVGLFSQTPKDLELKNNIKKLLKAKKKNKNRINLQKIKQFMNY